ncbi:MAG: efflux RND transporter periplasmic adaptor subunit [Puniceicoccaceae bacterium]
MDTPEETQPAPAPSLTDKALKYIKAGRITVVHFAKRRPKLATALGAVLLLIILTGLFGGGDDDTAYDFFKVTKGDFLVSIVEGGTLQAVNEITVRNEVPGNSRIVYIIPEGTYVKEGDLIIELDTEQAEKNLNEVMIRYEDDKADVIQTETNVLIQQSTAESQVRKAELAVQFAEMDLQKFEEIEKDQDIRNAEISIITAQESLKLAEERLEWSEKLTEEGFETKSRLDQDKLSVTNQTLGLEKAESSKKMLNEYDLAKQEAKLRSNLKEAQEELLRVKQQTQSRVRQAITQHDIEKRKLELSTTKLAQMQEYMEATKIYAPQDGLIVWAGSSNRYSQESMIEEGAMVRMRQAIIKIPDTSSMKVEIKVHESHVNQVQLGQQAFVVLDAFPDNRYSGTVSKIGLLPDPQSRFGNSNLKVYSTEILINDELPDIKPGASARAEIVITKLEDVLTVPIQSVTTVQGKQVCYVKGIGDPKPKEVEIGLFNNKFIEIVDGLSSGDRVLLAPPIDTSADLAGALLQPDEEVELPESQPAAKNQNQRPGVARSGAAAGAQGQRQPGAEQVMGGDDEARMAARAERMRQRQEQAQAQQAKQRPGGQTREGGERPQGAERRAGGGGNRGGGGGGGGGGGRG